MWKKPGGIPLLHLTRQVICVLFFLFSLSASDCSAALCGIVRVVQPLADALLRMDGWVDGWTDGGAGVEV